MSGRQGFSGDPASRKKSLCDPEIPHALAEHSPNPFEAFPGASRGPELSKTFTRDRIMSLMYAHALDYAGQGRLLDAAVDKETCHRKPSYLQAISPHSRHVFDRRQRPCHSSCSADPWGGSRSLANKRQRRLRLPKMVYHLANERVNFKPINIPCFWANADDPMLSLLGLCMRPPSARSDIGKASNCFIWTKCK